MSSFTSMGSDVSQAKAEARAQSMAIKAQAAYTQYQSAEAQKESEERTERLMGRQRVLAAKAGINPDSGSAGELVIDTIKRGTLEKEKIKWMEREELKTLAWQRKLAKKGGQVATAKGWTNFAVTVGSMAAGGIAGSAGIGTGVGGGAGVGGSTGAWIGALRGMGGGGYGSFMEYLGTRSPKIRSNK